MSDQTAIEWCDATFNPWIGCAKVSPGCAHCYAETLVQGRMGRGGTWGDDGVRQVTSDSNWKRPLRWARLAREGRLPDGSENLDGHRPRVFCASLADVFEERPELEAPRVRLFKLILGTPELDWLVLTKRPDVALEFFTEIYRFRRTAHFSGPLPTLEGTVPRNVWLGTSIENARHTWRADVLREIPAAVRFLSCEPLLGSLYAYPSVAVLARLAAAGAADERARQMGGVEIAAPVAAGLRAGAESLVADARAMHRKPLDLTGISWVIIGGESGHGARPMRLEWAREIRDDALEHGTAVFFKQWGGRTPKSGGKVLDGREWCEYPAKAAA